MPARRTATRSATTTRRTAASYDRRRATPSTPRTRAYPTTPADRRPECHAQNVILTSGRPGDAPLRPRTSVQRQGRDRHDHHRARLRPAVDHDGPVGGRLQPHGQGHDALQPIAAKYYDTSSPTTSTGTSSRRRSSRRRAFPERPDHGQLHPGERERARARCSTTARCRCLIQQTSQIGLAVASASPRCTPDCSPGCRSAARDGLHDLLLPGARHRRRLGPRHDRGVHLRVHLRCSARRRSGSPSTCPA